MSPKDTKNKQGLQKEILNLSNFTNRREENKTQNMQETCTLNLKQRHDTNTKAKYDNHAPTPPNLKLALSSMESE